MCFMLLWIQLATSTPLDDYVRRPDSSYKYDIMDVDRKLGYTLYALNMTSQTWKAGELLLYMTS